MKYFTSRNKKYFQMPLALMIALFFSILGTVHASGTESHAGEESKSVDVAALMIHHVSDTHDWHILDIPQGNGHYMPVAVHLPWILYDNREGLQFFGNTEALEASGKYKVYHEHAVAISEAMPVSDISVEEARINPAYVVISDAHGHGPEQVFKKAEGASIIDLSITKTVLHIMIVGIALILVFTSVAGAYRRRPGQVPKGLQSLLEPVIVFVKEDIAIPNLQGKHERYLPYLLTLFFFIWFSNIFGLTPLNSNIAGNISVTVALAVLTFLITTFSASKSYWGHVFWFPGVPLPIKFLMMPVEIVGMFTKPFALTVRLFANIAAGHLMVLALIGLIFILGKGGTSLGGGLSMAPLTLAFGLFIFMLEVLVAAVQAYVFTLLTAVFIGQAMEDHSHDHAHEGHHGH
jgi:F-type H+-transporting ATPase subunit a